MGYLVRDRVREASSVSHSGTGSFILAGALAGRKTFSSICTINDIFPYCAVLGDQWETGIGAYSAANTIARTYPCDGSSGKFTLVNFATGAKDIFIDNSAAAIKSKPLNPYQFGGDPASSDSATAINAAITVASAEGGRAVLIPGGGTWTASQISMKSYVALIGEGWGSLLQQKNNANADFIILNSINVERTIISNLRLECNKANQSSGSGIYYDNAGGTFTSTDPRHSFNNLYIHDAKEHGVYLKGSGEGHIYGVKVGNADKNGFNIPGVDWLFTACVANTCGLEGFLITGSNNHLSNCKAWYNGNITPANGDGYRITANRCVISGCEAQDNKQHGFNIDGSANGTKDNTITGCTADSNGSGTTGYGFALDRASSTVIDGCSAFDRLEFGPPNQAGPLLMQNTGAGSGSTVNCRVRLIAESNVINTAVGAQVVENDVILNGVPLWKINQVSTDRGDASATPSVNAARILLWNTPLTGGRNCTLPDNTTTRYNGLIFRVVRTANATGASNLNIKDGGTTIKTLAVGQWADATFDGTNWIIAAAGPL
jgi:parallel beta-helix repeat protein